MYPEGAFVDQYEYIYILSNNVFHWNFLLLNYLHPPGVAGRWSPWSEWSRCGRDCHQSRRRQCVGGEREREGDGDGDGDGCPGRAVQSAPCSGGLCPHGDIPHEGRIFQKTFYLLFSCPLAKEYYFYIWSLKK